MRLRLAALTIGLAMSLLLAEAVVRLFCLDHSKGKTQAAPLWLQKQRAWIESAYQDDPEAGYIHRPNVELTLVDEFGVPVVFRTDSNGLRVGAATDQPQDGEVVAVLGDSFVQAAKTPYEKTFCAALSRLLGGSPVLNIGVGGYSNQQEIASARRVVPEYDVEWIILAVYAGNDLRDNLLRSRWSNLEPSPAPWRTVARKSALLRFVARTVHQVPQRTLFGEQYDWKSYFDAELVQYDSQISSRNAEIFGEARSATSESLSAFRELAKELGARPLVVFIPTKAMVYQEPLFISKLELTPWAKDALFTVAQRGFDFDRNRTLWRTLVEQAQLPFLDLTEEFRANRDKRIYGLTDRHWSEAGQRIAAEVVARHLRQTAFQEEPPESSQRHSMDP